MARRPETQLSDLIEAAIEVFIAKGYRRTHMADVARAAGVSQGTLYNYVESKEALFYLILDRGFNRKPNRARSVPAAAGSSDRRAAASGNRRVVRASSAQHARFDDDHRRGLLRGRHDRGLPGRDSGGALPPRPLLTGTTRSCRAGAR